MMKILIVEDDKALNNGIALSLGNEVILQAYCIEEAKKFLDSSIDMVLLDINLPDGSGLDFCSEIRKTSQLPIIFLTANDMEIDIVTGLETGADDYIVKPFSLAVLRARVNAVARRRQNNNDIFRSGKYEFDFESMRFWVDNIPVELIKTAAAKINGCANPVSLRNRLCLGAAEMRYIIVMIILVLIVMIGVIYFRTSQILTELDKMLDSAINNTFVESMFSEGKLSKIESKMYRYLLSGSTSLKQINSEKDNIKTLIADISHQTKTPISNILLYSQLLKEIPVLDDNTRRIASQIEEQTEKLSFLTASLIKTSRLENGIINVVPKENSIKKLLECIDYQDMANAKKIHYSIESAVECTAVFDFKWTLEAVSNIVDNAIKYTASGGRVALSMREYEMFACINVEDTGIGISEEEIAQIFGRFYRSPEVSDERGVGIGLYLAREILTKEGGYIKVSSEKGKGSVFSVFLPKLSQL